MGINKMKIKLYGDGADIKVMSKQHMNREVDGFTTNPTLMSKSGITDYMSFANEVLSIINDVSISFEVFSDDIEEMEEQAYKLNELGNNVWVKIPVTNTKSESTSKLVENLTNNGVKVNVTAVFTKKQVKEFYDIINPNTNTIISIFAGRIANAGVDPEPIVKYAVELCKNKKNIEILWASPREAFNIIQADRVGCHIITATPEIIKASNNFGKDLNKYSLETVEMFYNDAKSSGFSI